MKKLKLLVYEFNLPYLINDIDYPVGGATIEWYSWIRGLIQNNCQVGILTWKGAKDYISKPVKFDIVETYGLNDGIPKLRWIYKRFPLLLKAVKEYNPDYLIQECAGFGTGIMGFIAKILKIPFIYRVASNMDTDKRYKQILTLTQQLGFKYGLSNADAVFCQNTYQYQSIKKKYPHKKCEVIHNPYYYETKLSKNNNFFQRKYIAWIGGFRYQKNLPALLNIIKSLTKIKFKIAGEPVGNMDKLTKKALDEIEQYNNVEFVGYLKRKEVLKFLSNAYALLNTSRIEGFSNTFLEAFAAGTPVVTLSKVDPDNIIANNNLGIIKEYYSELPQALLDIINNQNNNFSERCKVYLKNNHDPKILGKKFIEYLNSIDN